MAQVNKQKQFKRNREYYHKRKNMLFNWVPVGDVIDIINSYDLYDHQKLCKFNISEVKDVVQNMLMLDSGEIVIQTAKQIYVYTEQLIGCGWDDTWALYFQTKLKTTQLMVMLIQMAMY